MLKNIVFVLYILRFICYNISVCVKNLSITQVPGLSLLFTPKKGNIRIMENKILVETSARHVHLTEEAVQILFGEGHTLTNKKDLSQPGQFACEEKVTVIGPKGAIKASVLGPTRPANQVELSFTDARTVGIVPPIRESGDVAGTPGCTLEGPCGKIEIAEGVMVAKRHIHMTPEDAEALGVADKEIVSVKVDTARPVIFGDVVVRVSPKFALAMHIDTAESNAACASGLVYGSIVK
jgi:putative phosphotransacetylase